MHASPRYLARRSPSAYWMSLAAVAALLPEVVLPLMSYLTLGYLDLDSTLLVALLLPCSGLALVSAIHEMRPLWSSGLRQEAALLLGLTVLGLILAIDTADTVWSGATSCYDCRSWFFYNALPALLLEFVAGVTWLLLLKDALRRRHSTPTGTA